MPKPENFHYADLIRLLTRLSYQLFIPILLLASMEFVLTRKETARRTPICPQPLYDDPFQSIVLTQDFLLACEEKNWNHVSHHMNDNRLIAGKIHECAVEAAKSQNLQILKDLRARTTLFDLSAQSIFKQLRQSIQTSQDANSTKLITALNLLLKHGAKPVISAKSDESSKMMLIAAKEDLHEAAEYFYKNRKKLHLALYKPVKVDMKFSNVESLYVTYLEFACLYGSRNVVNFILKQHALNKVATSKTPKYYTYAAAMNHAYLFHLLSQHSLSITEGEIFSLLDDLEKAQQKDELKFKLLSQSYNLLIRNFPTPNIYNTEGHSMLSRVLELKSTGLLELFIAHPHINLHMPRKMYSKELAIFTAVENHFHEAIVMMYEKGFDPGFRLSKNNSSLKEFITNQMNYTFVTHLGNSTSAMNLRDEIAFEFFTTFAERALIPAFLLVIVILKMTLFFAEELKKQKKARETIQANRETIRAKKDKKAENQPAKKPSRTEVIHQIKAANLAKNAEAALKGTRMDFKNHLNQALNLFTPLKQGIQKNYESIASLHKKTLGSLTELKSECKSHDREFTDCRNGLPPQEIIESRDIKQIEASIVSIKTIHSKLKTLQARIQTLEESIERNCQSQERTRQKPATPNSKTFGFFSQNPAKAKTHIVIADQNIPTPEAIPFRASVELPETRSASTLTQQENLSAESVHPVLRDSIPAPETPPIFSFNEIEILMTQATTKPDSTQNPDTTLQNEYITPSESSFTVSPDVAKPATSLTTPPAEDKAPQSFARDSNGFFLRETKHPFTHTALIPFTDVVSINETYEGADFEENDPVIQSIVSLIR